MLISAIIMLINTFLFMYVGCKSYASDTEWSRYWILEVLTVSALLALNIVHYVSVSNNISFLDNEVFKAEKTDNCKAFFQMNITFDLICAIITSVVLCVQLYQIVKMLYMFLLGPVEKELYAVNEDTDIEVI